MADSHDEPVSDGKPVSFGDLRGHLMPSGTGQEALWKSLRQARRTGGPLPGRIAPDISAGASQAPEIMRNALPSGLPADPFGHTDSASIALAEMFNGMLAAGIPVASVESILGHMLAAMPGETGPAVP